MIYHHDANKVTLQIKIPTPIRTDGWNTAIIKMSSNQVKRQGFKLNQLCFEQIRKVKSNQLYSLQCTKLNVDFLFFIKRNLQLTGNRKAPLWSLAK